MLQNSAPVTLNIKSASLTEALDLILKGNGLQYEIINKTVVIKKADASPEKPAISQTAQLPISGLVTDEAGKPILGVSITVKNTSRGASSNAQGRFEIDIAKGDIIRFTAVGYEPQEVIFDNEKSLVVKMVLSISSESEIIVIGYGTQKKSDLTGAVSRVSEDKLQSRPVANVSDALAGRSSGVQVQQLGGDLTGKFNINIRGVGTVNGKNGPLLVVDNVPLFSGDLSTINPKDIVSIDILKDASATAIFGARASNGVLMVTTRSGSAGKATVTFDAEYGFEKITNKIEMLNSEEQRQLFVDAFKNSNRSTAGFDDPSDPVWQINSSWQDLGIQTGVRQNYNLNISGGTESIRYSFSGGYLNRKGVMLNTDVKTYTMRSNLAIKANDWLKFTANIAGSRQDESYNNNDAYLGGAYQQLLSSHSYVPAYDDAGGLTSAPPGGANPYFGANDNPLINLLLPTNQRGVTRLMGNIKMDINLMKNLVLSGNAGGDLLNSDGYSYFPLYAIQRQISEKGTVTVRNGKQINWVTDLTLNYNTKFNHHTLNALVGISAQQFKQEKSDLTASGTVDNILNQVSNQPNVDNKSGSKYLSGLSSAFARLNYDYGKKYLVTATLRRDGSSNFGASNRYGYFPSGSIAWKISEEKFMDQVVLVRNLKLRVSYGVTGNQDIAPFSTLSLAGASNYVFGNNVVSGNVTTSIGNPDLKWEAAKQFDMGLDFSLVKGRINATIDYYNKRSTNLLIQSPLPFTSGVSSSPWVNLGSVSNTGFEFSINSKNIAQRNFEWTTDFNISFNKNKVLDIGSNAKGDALLLPGINLAHAQTPANLTKAGWPIGSFYVYDFIGVWQLGEEAAAAAYYSGGVPGDPKYADLNGNKMFDSDDRRYAGSPFPKFFGGMDNTFTYRNFSLSIFMNYSYGAKLINVNRMLLSRGVPFLQNTKEIYGWWTPKNPSNTIPRPSQGGTTTTQVSRASTRFLQKADFIRLKNLSIGYDLSNIKVVKRARISLSATNLFTITPYTGMDPETSSVESLISAGLDQMPYPLTRQFTGSLFITL